MLLSDCPIGHFQETLELELLSTTIIAEDLLKLLFSDSEKSRVNVFVETPSHIAFFSQLKSATKVSFNGISTSKNFKDLAKFIPGNMTGQSIASHEATVNFFILIGERLPNMKISFGARSLQVDSKCNLETLGVEKLYEPAKRSAGQVEKVGGNSKCLSLKQISEKVATGNVYAWCYAIIVDSCSSYLPKQGEPSDYLSIFKLTDSSIFPNTISLQIFHKHPKEMPKVANFGDIIKLNNALFKEYKGSIIATISSKSLTTSFYLFSYFGDVQSAYATFRSSFHTSKDHAMKLDKISEWVKNTFAYEVPFFIKGSKRLIAVSSNEEADILTKVLAVCSLGINKGDPLVLICGDSNEIAQLVVPTERKNLIKFISPGDLIRVRGVECDEKVIFLRHYSDILRIPPEFKCLSIPDYNNTEELRRYVGFYMMIDRNKTISRCAMEYNTAPVVSIEYLRDVQNENPFKVEGVIVKLTFKRRSVFIHLWDGEKEENILEIIVTEDRIQEFMNGKSWERINSEVVNYNCKFQGVIRKENGVFKLLGTILIN